jgi:hypothetical protein
MKAKKSSSIRINNPNCQVKFNPKMGYDVLVLPTPKKGIELIWYK